MLENEEVNHITEIVRSMSIYLPDMTYEFTGGCKWGITELALVRFCSSVSVHMVLKQETWMRYEPIRANSDVVALPAKMPRSWIPVRKLNICAASPPSGTSCDATASISCQLCSCSTGTCASVSSGTRKQTLAQFYSVGFLTIRGIIVKSLFVLRHTSKG